MKKCFLRLNEVVWLVELFVDEVEVPLVWFVVVVVVVVELVSFDIVVVEFVELDEETVSGRISS